MSTSTAPLDQLATTQEAKEAVVNGLTDALSPSALFGKRLSTTSGLTFGYYGGSMLVDGVPTAISHGTVALSASVTNYVEATRAGVVSKNTTGFTAGQIPLYQIVTGTSTITSWTDYRAWAQPIHVSQRLALVMGSDANRTLTAAESRCGILDITSSTSLTNTRDIVLPLAPQTWDVYNGTTGGQSLRFIGASGTGITVTNGTRARIYSDGTNIVQVSSGGGGGGGTELKDLTFTSDVDSTADSDPGNGLFKWNNATQASATFLYFDNQTVDAISLTTFYASLGSSGFIYLQQSDDATKWQLWKWTSTPTDGTGYRKFPVALQASGGSIADNKTVYCDFSSAGGGSTIGQHMLPVPARGMNPRSANGCAALAVSAGASGQPDYEYLAFDPSAVEYAEFSIDMPESWDEGTVTFQAVWAHPSTSTNFGVTWSLQGLAVSDNESIAQNFGTAQNSNDTGGTTGNKYKSPTSSAITIAGTPATADTVFFRIAREVADGGDTMAVDAHLIGIRLYYTTAAEVD
jgi:hypothetical protein